mgnify:CR=1 FL=1
MRMKPLGRAVIVGGLWLGAAIATAMTPLLPVMEMRPSNQEQLIAPYAALLDNGSPEEGGQLNQDPRPCAERVPLVSALISEEMLSDAGEGLLPLLADCGAAPQQVALNPVSVSFIGGFNQSSPAANNVALSSSTSSTWTATTHTASGGSWLHATPASGTAPGHVSISVNTAGLALGTYHGTVRVTATGVMNSPQVVPVKLTVANLPDTGAPTAPTGLVATAMSMTRVELTWTGSTDNSGGTGVDHYEVWRKVDNNPYAKIAEPSANRFTDTAVTPSKAYAYKIVAVDGATPPNASATSSNVDLATTVTFTDDPLTAWTTVDKVTHVNELRQAVNAARSTAGLPTANWTDPTVTAITPIKKVHVDELRAQLNQARTALSVLAITFTDSTLTTSTLIKKVHVEELRNGVK